MKNCLKCGYQRLPTDEGPDTTCPKCGAIYAKVEAAIAAKIRQQADKPVAAPVASIAKTSAKSTVGNDEKICTECAAVIRAKAEICPKCGVRQMPAPFGENALAAASFGDPKKAGIDQGAAQARKKSRSKFLKPLLLVMGIGMVGVIVLPMLGGGHNRPNNKAAEPQQSQDEICRDSGDNIAKVYFANINKMNEVGILPSEMMNEGCQKQWGGKGAECVNLCKDGFKYRAQKWVKG